MNLLDCFERLAEVARRLRFAGGERGSHLLQVVFNTTYNRMLATKHAPGGAFRILERLHGLADIVESGAAVLVDRLRIIHPNQERDIITFSDNA